ncbi:MAG: hypothetical protein IPN79_13310 [Saprospiraceae bacterium]|nr:hypothetical protein [Saprospiraceae bacterium]
MKWIKPNTITGSVAQGKKYFRRKDIEDKIWYELLQNNSVLFLAPRRVGKSSIVSFMAENANEGFICKYEVIQSIDSVQEFFKRTIKMIDDSLSAYGKSKEWFLTWWKSWTIKTIGKDKVEIGDKDIDYRSTFFDLLDHLKNKDVKVVLFLDEFPDVVLNVSNKEGEKNAALLLDDVRTICHEKKFKETFVMVLLGSVGLTHIVKRITGRIDKINHLHTEHLPPLTNIQSRSFLDFLLEGATMQVNMELKEYILKKIGNYIPYYIQLLIEECDEILIEEERPILTKKNVNQAYKQLLKKNEKFEDWDNRLSKYFGEIYPFLKKVLSKCAGQNKISLQEIFDIAVKYELELQWKAHIDDILVADGYIFEDKSNFYFVSPLLRDWWQARNPQMN